MYILKNWNFFLVAIRWDRWCQSAVVLMTLILFTTLYNLIISSNYKSPPWLCHSSWQEPHNSSYFKSIPGNKVEMFPLHPWRLAVLSPRQTLQSARWSQTSGLWQFLYKNSTRLKYLQPHDETGANLRSRRQLRRAIDAGIKEVIHDMQHKARGEVLM